MIDYETLAQQAAEERLVGCLNALYAEDDDQTAPWPEDMAGPFCGCETCVVREVLHAAWPHMRNLARAEFADQIEIELGRVFSEDEDETSVRDDGAVPGVAF